MEVASSVWVTFEFHGGCLGSGGSDDCRLGSIGTSGGMVCWVGLRISAMELSARPARMLSGVGGLTLLRALSEIRLLFALAPG